MSESFSITQTPNTSENVILNYSSVGLTNLNMDTQNSWISATCSRSSSPNVTYTNTSNVTTKYYASKLWIIGGGSGSKYPLHNFSGYPTTVFPKGSPTAELIIKNDTEDYESHIYTCFLLNYVGSSAPPGSQIDNMFMNISNKQTQLTVNLNEDIFRSDAPNAKHIQYTSKKLGGGSNVIIYSEPINIGSTQVELLQNNLGLFDMYNSVYSITSSMDQGDWMECDYVPIDSEDVTTYSLPIDSGIVQDASGQTTIQTIMMFIVFAILTTFAYILFPKIYFYLLQQWVQYSIGNAYLGMKQKEDKISSFDFWISMIWCGIAFLLIFAGAFWSNEGAALSTGLTMSIYYILSYVIIQSKKTDATFLKDL